MSRFYPTVYNSIDDFELPAFEIRENLVYPTIYNEKYDYGLSSFDIRS